MSCACKNKQLSSERDRIFRLAKALAKLEQVDVIIFKNDDGSFGFRPASDEIDKPIVEYITPY